MFNGFNVHPATVSEAIRQIILCLVLFGVVQWTDQQIAGLLMAVSAVLALFTRSNTISTQKLDQRVEERVAQVQQGVRAPDATQADYQRSHPDYRRNHTGGTGMFIGIIALAGLTLAGCSAKQQQIALQADRAVHGGLAAVQDTVDGLCDNKVMQESDCQAFNRRLIPALEAGQAFNRAVRAEREGQLGPIVVAVGRLTEAVTALVPEQYRSDLLRRLQAILSNAYQEAQQ